MDTGIWVVKNGWGAPLWRLHGRLPDPIYLPVCLGCDTPVATADALCPASFRALRPITAPLGLVLGQSFEASNGPDVCPADAIADPPPFDRARSAVVNNEVARALVGKLKYGDRPELARLCTRLTARTGHDLWGADAVLVPARSHRTQKLSRRYNQSMELARALSCLRGVPVDPLLVMRRTKTRQQVGFSCDARRRHGSGAFMADPQVPRRLAGRRGINVDDVVTSGSAVKAVTRPLKSAGAGRVDVVSCAHVVSGTLDGLY